MRTLYLFLFFSLLSLPTFAQIQWEVSYNQENKEATLKITNELNNNIYLSPRMPDDPFSKDFCWYETRWKDKSGNIVDHWIPAMIYGPKMGCYIKAKDTRFFVLDLKSNISSAKSVEVFFHLEIHTRGKDPIQWKEEFTKTFEY